MILVTLGTQDKQFYRLLDIVEKEIKNKNITEEVIVQAGYSSNYKSKYMKIFDLIPIDKFNELINKCDLLITHGGVGSITTGLKNNKKIIAMARLKKYGEHTNDHQLQIVKIFSEEGYILSLEENDSLKDALNKIKTFKPKKYKSNTNKFIKIVEKEINKIMYFYN